LHQDVYKTEIWVVKGRHAHDIVVYKFQNLQTEKQKQKNIRKRAITTVADNGNGNGNNNNDEPKQQYRVISENEQKILGPIILYKVFPDENIINDIIQQLNNVGYTDWNSSRIKKYWSNHNIFRHSKKQK